MNYNNKLEEKLAFINEERKTTGSIVERVEEIKLSLFSPEEVLANSYGQVISAETLNYRTHKPVPGGLHCELIFGPYSNWECSCGKYKGKMYKGIKCPDCGVSIDSSNVRRTRMGHIELNVPIVHTWFYTAISNNPICHLLDISQRDLVELVHYRKYLILDRNFEKNFNCSIITFEEYDLLTEEQMTLAGQGGKILLKALQMLNLPVLLEKLLSERESEYVLKRINTVNMFINGGVKPEHMIITVLPVLPADLRPIVALESGAIGTTDVNYFYRSIILRNKRLEVLEKFVAPNMIRAHGYAHLQKGVDTLIDNSKLKQPLKNKTRILKSLTDELSGKKGILRMNLLGKRVDFSARSVIVVDPSLKLNQCGIPKDMALELFKPFIIQRLMHDKLASNVDSARRIISERGEEVWAILRDISSTRNIIINRAPSLHKHSMQSFDILLVEGYAIKIHPLVCVGFNADFDGDQMAVYLSITPQTAIETRILMHSVNNTFSHASGKPVISPVREILMGCYFISMLKKSEKTHTFTSIKNAIACFNAGKIAIQEEINLYHNKSLIKTNIGRILINEILPLEMRNYEVLYDKKAFDNLIYRIQEAYGFNKLAEVLDDIKELGFYYSSKSAISMSLKDMCTPTNKKQYIDVAQSEIDELQDLKDNNKILPQELSAKSILVWTEAVNKITENLVSEYGEFNDLYITMKSGARGGIVQSRQLSGIKGLIADSEGRILQNPILSSYKEGLTSFEYFVSSYGARKGIIDKNIKTANAGYLTRRLVDVAHDIVIQEEDCNSMDYIIYPHIYGDNKEVILSKNRRIIGRCLAVDTLCIDGTLLKRNHVLTEQDIEKIDGDIKIRSIFTCKAKGACSACYGNDLSSRRVVDVGSTIGIIAAQSIGEPATQLTMRTFHTGGVIQRSTSASNTYAIENGNITVNEESIKVFGGYKLYKYIFICDSTITLGKNKYEVKAGDILCVEPNSYVIAGNKIVIHEPLVDVFFAPITGKLTFEDAVYETHTSEYTKIYSRKASDNFMVKIIATDGTEASLYIRSGSFKIFSDIQVNKGDILFKTIREQGIGDIVDDLSRVQDLLEVRKSSYKAMYSPANGKAYISLEAGATEKDKKATVTIKSLDGSTWVMNITNNNVDDLLINDQADVRIGEQITKGDIDLSYILEYFALSDAKVFLLDKIKSVYLNSSIDINDKHLEVIIEKIFRFVKVSKNIDEFFVGEVYSRNDVEIASNKRVAEGKEAIQFKTVAMGITKVSMSSEGFISAASFQSTKKVLAKSALRGAVDHLNGLKENIIVGNPIPAGSGKNYDNVSAEEKSKNIFYLCQKAFKTLEAMLKINPRLTEENGWLDSVISAAKNKE